MAGNVILVSFILHIIGDFYLQSRKMAREKNYRFLCLVWHSVIYSIPFGAAFIALSDTGAAAALFLFALVAAHFGVDILKTAACAVVKKLAKTDYEHIIYIADQVMHALSIFAVYSLFREFGHSPAFVPGWIAGWEADYNAALKWILLLLIVCKPANITFIKLCFKNFCIWCKSKFWMHKLDSF